MHSNRHTCVVPPFLTLLRGAAIVLRAATRAAGRDVTAAAERAIRTLRVAFMAEFISLFSSCLPVLSCALSPRGWRGVREVQEPCTYTYVPKMYATLPLPLPAQRKSLEHVWREGNNPTCRCCGGRRGEDCRRSTCGSGEAKRANGSSDERHQRRSEGYTGEFCGDPEEAGRWALGADADEMRCTIHPRTAMFVALATDVRFLWPCPRFPLIFYCCTTSCPPLFLHTSFHFRYVCSRQ